MGNVCGCAGGCGKRRDFICLSLLRNVLVSGGFCHRSIPNQRCYLVLVLFCIALWDGGGKRVDVVQVSKRACVEGKGKGSPERW